MDSDNGLNAKSKICMHEGQQQQRLNPKSTPLQQS
jgi:hypothetical protein